MVNDRLYRLKELLLSWRGIGMQALIQGLEVAKTTVKRDVEALRDWFNDPIARAGLPGSYFIQSETQHNSRWVAKRSELTELWFSSDEAVALPTVRPPLVSIEPGILGPKLKPLPDKLNRLLESYGHYIDIANSRIKATQPGKRRLMIESFQAARRGTLEHDRPRMMHFNRHDGEECRTQVQRAQLPTLGRYV